MDNSTLQTQWHNGICINHRGHILAAKHYERVGLALGIPAIALSAIAGSAVFANVGERPDLWVQILVGMLSMIAAVLASLQTFLKYPELAQKHKASAVAYGRLRREFEQHIAGNQPGKDEVVLSGIRSKWDSMDEEAPCIPQSIYTEAHRLTLKRPKT